jgi:hypothetical protein
MTMNFKFAKGSCVMLLTILCFTVYAESSESWEWPDANLQKSNGKEQCWLQECLLSLSSTGELLVIAHRNVMIILTCEFLSAQRIIPVTFVKLIRLAFRTFYDIRTQWVLLLLYHQIKFAWVQKINYKYRRSVCCAVPCPKVVYGYNTNAVKD